MTLKLGRGGEIRTPDILVPNQARYQTTLRPEVRHYTGLDVSCQLLFVILACCAGLCFTA